MKTTLLIIGLLLVGCAAEPEVDILGFNIADPCEVQYNLGIEFTKDKPYVEGDEYKLNMPDTIASFAYVYEDGVLTRFFYDPGDNCSQWSMYRLELSIEDEWYEELRMASVITPEQEKELLKFFEQWDIHSFVAPEDYPQS